MHRNIRRNSCIDPPPFNQFPIIIYPHQITSHHCNMAHAARRSKAQETDAAARTYEDFEPAVEVLREPVKATILVFAPGFKKEQIKLQVDSQGRLTIIGERPLEGNQWSRFHLELPIPEGCNVDGIHAKFEKDGPLHITMPMLSPAGEPKAPDAKTGDDASQDQKAPGHGSTQQTIAAEAEQEKKHQEEGDARKRPDQNEEHTSEADGGRGKAVARLPAEEPNAPDDTMGNDASQDQNATGHASAQQTAEEEDARKRPEREDEHKSEGDGVRGEAVARLSPAGEPKAPDAKTGNDASQDQKAAGHGSARQAAAAEAEQEKQRPEEEDARKRPDQEEEHKSEGDGGRGKAVAAPTTRPACGELRDRRKVVWTLLLAVVLALVGAALYAKYRLMDPSAEPAPADDGFIGLSDY